MRKRSKPPEPMDRSGVRVPMDQAPRWRLVESLRDEIGGRAGRDLADENENGDAQRQEHIRHRAERAMKGRPTELGPCGRYKSHRWVITDNRKSRGFCPRCGLIVEGLSGGHNRVVGRDRSLIVGKVKGRQCPITHRQRLGYGVLLAERDGGWVCWYCHAGLDGADDETWTLDHYIPRNRGGSDGLDNLRLACLPCNNRKGDRMPESLNLKAFKQPSGIPLSLGVKKGFVRAGSA